MSRWYAIEYIMTHEEDLVIPVVFSRCKKVVESCKNDFSTNIQELIFLNKVLMKVCILCQKYVIQKYNV